MLDQEAINKFKELYLKHYKIELSDEEARFRAQNLLSIYEAVYGDWANKQNKNDEQKTNG